MEGIIPLLGYLGIVITAIVVIRNVGRMMLRGRGDAPALPHNPVTIDAIGRLFRHLYRREPIILLIFGMTAAGLIAKYFGGMTGFPEYFLEFINSPGSGSKRPKPSPVSQNRSADSGTPTVEGGQPPERLCR